ncbi:unnamed protein product [Pleuronectes platessa]|uniref:Uncharacterized protein n=1 Tax=Pleuronectes platessa TaxID=8262 RepID=A0A9N7TUB8_PLEPL|nr:unnamed protein product [Pleuronectes platessa]
MNENRLILHHGADGRLCSLQNKLLSEAESLPFFWPWGAEGKLLKTVYNLQVRSSREKFTNQNQNGTGLKKMNTLTHVLALVACCCCQLESPPGGLEENHVPLVYPAGTLLHALQPSSNNNNNQIWSEQLAIRDNSKETWLCTGDPEHTAGCRTNKCPSLPQPSSERAR